MAVIAVSLALVSTTPGAEAAIPTPPRHVLESALRSINDPQLAAQVRPDQAYGAADCVVHLGLYRPSASAEPLIAINRASKAWRSSLVSEMGENFAAQMIGSTVNPLEPTPAPLRQAAAAWCLANAPAQ